MKRLLLIAVLAIACAHHRESPKQRDASPHCFAPHPTVAADEARAKALGEMQAELDAVVANMHAEMERGR